MPDRPDTDSILDGLRESDADYVKVAVTDIDGILRGKYLDKQKFLSATETGFGFCNVVFGWDAGERQLTIRLHDRHYAVTNANRTVEFTAQRFAAPLTSCADGKLKTIQYDGNKVYWDGETAWRCVRGTKGNVRLAAAGPNLPDVALAQIVSSGRHL